ncbi:hypothetical protein HX857_20355 [Pseudomonas gingeri]|uniref:hypothetical protein n=1 Tax=Pseudomonas gingeri TaxID=117681 RepID=UPI0015C03C0C|nr:hypothetical protein [Pseudomonas gingeri]NWE71056.1 hypothetical protein [Pseudomonas gingeri]
MERYIPLSTNFTVLPVLVIDTQASLDDLQTSAYQRLQAASDLLETMTCVSLNTTCDKDLPHVTNAAYLLVREGCDLLQLVQQRTMALSRQVAQ